MSARYPYIGDIIKLKKQVGSYSPGKRGIITEVDSPHDGEKLYIVKFRNIISGTYHNRTIHRNDFVVPRNQAIETYYQHSISNSIKKQARYQYDDKEII